MSVLLLGEKGYLGSYIYENLDVDILNTRELYDNGKEYKYVINCTGKPNLEYCENNRYETDYSNRDVILDIQKYYPLSKIINFSSYYVYDSDTPNNEDSPVSYLYNYTRQKLESEVLIKNGVSFRIGKLFGHHHLDKQDKLTEHIIKNNYISLDDVMFNPTSLDQIINIINHEIKNNTFFGVYNLANEGVTTHYEYGVFISNTLNTSKIITKVDKLNRIFHNYGKFVMNCDKIKKHVPLNHWKDDMVKYLKLL